MEVITTLTGKDLMGGIWFHGDSLFDSETVERLKELTILLEEVFAELASLERGMSSRREASAKEIECQLEAMRSDLLRAAFGEEVAEKIIELLERQAIGEIERGE